MSKFIEVVLLVMLLSLCVACVSENGTDGEEDGVVWSIFPGGTSVEMAPLQIEMVLSAAPLNVQTGATVEFTVNADPSRGVITESMIDFENDGLWDESHDHDSESISVSFTHVYVVPGYYRATAKVRARYTNDLLGIAESESDQEWVYITVADPARSN